MVLNLPFAQVARRVKRQAPLKAVVLIVPRESMLPLPEPQYALVAQWAATRVTLVPQRALIAWLACTKRAQDPSSVILVLRVPT